MAVDVEAAPVPGWQRGRVASWLVTTDHKRIGILYLATSGLFFVAGGIMALLIRTQLAQADAGFIERDGYNELFTIHGTTMIFLVVVPILAGFANYLVPLMIGARDMAFPRLNALTYWLFLFGGVILLLSFFAQGGAARGGWTSYPPNSVYSAGNGQDLWILSLHVLTIASLAGAINFVVTIHNLRTQGMSWTRLPLFVWSVEIYALLLIVVLPTLSAGLTLLLLDRQASTNFFVPSEGGSAVLYQHAFWFFGHPEVYIMILPVMGIISEVIPVFSRKPIFGYKAIAFSTVAIGFFSMLVWAHHMFTIGMPSFLNAFFMVSSMVIAVPTGVKILNWIGTLWGGRIYFSSALYFSLGFIAMFTLGGLSGVMHASPPVDLQQTDSYFIVAHFHYVLFGGSIFGLFSGIYYWWPKIFGKLLDERLGKLHFWLMMIGFNVTFFPMHFLGLVGMPRRIYTYAPDLGWNFWNLVATIGSLVIVLSFLIFIWNVITTTRSGADAPADPWDGRTLEWTIPSPPPVYNFATVPVVHDRDDFWAQKHGDGHGTPPRKGAAAPAEDPASIHMPPPSYWPILLAGAFFVMMSGVLVSIYQVIVGGFLTLYCMVRFMLEYHHQTDVAPPAGGHH